MAVSLLVLYFSTLNYSLNWWMWSVTHEMMLLLLLFNLKLQFYGKFCWPQLCSEHAEC